MIKEGGPKRNFDGAGLEALQEVIRSGIPGLKEGVDVVINNERVEKGQNVVTVSICAGSNSGLNGTSEVVGKFLAAQGWVLGEPVNNGAAMILEYKITRADD